MISRNDAIFDTSLIKEYFAEDFIVDDKNLSDCKTENGNYIIPQQHKN